jgi:hypothetical protein
MAFDLSNPHVVYVLAAYGAAVVLLGGLGFVTIRDYLRTKKK